MIGAEIDALSLGSDHVVAYSVVTCKKKWYKAYNFF
jgi:hypothetical protein